MKKRLYVYEIGDFFVVAAEFGTGRLKPKSKGFEVYEAGITHGKCVATIGYDGQAGLEKAKATADRLQARRRA